MKVCLISSVDKGNIDGSTVRPLNISENLALLGCEILHICFEAPVPRDNINYSYKYYKNANILKKGIHIFRWYIEVRRFSPDVVYAHQINNATIAIPLKILLRLPLVYDEHGSFAMDARPKKRKLVWERIIAKMSTRVIVAADDVNKIFTDVHNIYRENISTIINGTDLKLFKPNEPDIKMKYELGISDDEKIIAFTCPRGLPANDLALEYFFNLVPKIEEKIGTIKFLIIGGGPKPTPPSNNVIYTGFVDNIWSYINLGDVCIAPYPPASTCGTAGAKNKIIEYFACGKPVISTEEGIRGFDDAVPNRDFLLAKDSDDFLKKLHFVLNDKEISKNLGENAREYSLKYDWKNLSKEVLYVLESATR